MRKKDCLSDADFIDELCALIKTLEEDIDGLRSRLWLDRKNTLPLDFEYGLLKKDHDLLEQTREVLEQSIAKLISEECALSCVDCHGDCEDSALGRKYKSIKQKLDNEYHASVQDATQFRVPHGKYWNEFYRKWMPDPDVKKTEK